MAFGGFAEMLHIGRHIPKKPVFVTELIILADGGDHGDDHTAILHDFLLIARFAIKSVYFLLFGGI